MIKYDEQKIKLLPLTDLAEKLELNRQKGGNWECFNEAHKNQKLKPSLNITNNKGFYCHKCEMKGGNVIDLYMKVYNCSFREALRVLSEMYQIQSHEIEEFKKSPKHSDLLIEANYKNYVDIFQNQSSNGGIKARNELENRKISFDIAIKYQVGIVENFFVPQIVKYNEDKGTDFKANYDVISFPILDNDRKFIGLKYRFFEDDYKGLPSDIGIGKSMNIGGSKVGLIYSREGVDKSDEVILCEGEIDGLSLISLGFDNVVINMGGVMSCTDQIIDLCRDKKIVSFYDNDEAGNKGNQKLGNSIDKGNIYVPLFPSGESGKIDVNKLIQNGNGKNYFDELIKNAKPLDIEEIKEAQSDKTDNIEEILSAILPNNTMLNMGYDKNEKKSFLIIYSDGKVITNDSFKDKNDVYKPIKSNEDLFKHNVLLLPSNCKEYGTLNDLVGKIRRFIHKYVEVSDFFETISIYYVLMTWVFDKYNELPYLRVIADYGSGKTRYLQTVGSICYMSFFTSGATTVSPIFRMINKIQGTLILDEADFKSSNTTDDIIKILNNGYAKGVPVFRTEGGNDTGLEPRMFNIYGPKVISTRERFQDTALESRCITEELNKCNRNIPLNITDEFHRDALELRNNLMHFRFTNFHKPLSEKSCEESVILPSNRVEPRIRQIIMPLLDIIEDEKFAKDFIKSIIQYDSRLKEERRFSDEGEVFDALIEIIKDDNGPFIKDITDKYNEKFSNQDVLSTKKVGKIVREKLNLKTFRTNKGFVLTVRDNLIQIKKLMNKYGFSDVDIANIDDKYRTNEK